MDAQADLSLRWAHRSFCWFCHAVTKMTETNKTDTPEVDQEVAQSQTTVHPQQREEKKEDRKKLYQNIIFFQRRTMK